MGDMADYYDSRYDEYDGCDYHEDYYNDSKYENLTISYSLSILKAKAIYNINSKEKVGSEITCPVCKVKFKKKSYQQKFCNLPKRGSKCRDTYHNAANPERTGRVYANRNSYY